MQKSYQYQNDLSTILPNGKRKPTPKIKHVSLQYDFDYLPTSDDLADLLLNIGGGK